MYHQDLLKRTLNEFELEYVLIPIPSGSSGNCPKDFGEYYKLVGAGKLNLLHSQDILRFNDGSGDYSSKEKIFNTNKKHLKEMGFVISKEGTGNQDWDKIFYATLKSGIKSSEKNIKMNDKGELLLF